MRFFLAFFCFFCSLWAEILLFDNQNNQALNKTEQELNSKKSLKKQDIILYQNLSPSYEENGILQENSKPVFAPRGNLVLELINEPERVFVDEIFFIKIGAKSTELFSFDSLIEVDKSEDLLFLNPEPEWEFTGGFWQSKLYFQAKSSNAKLNQIKLNLQRNGQIYQSARIILPKIKFENVTQNKNYSHIVADNLQALRVKASRFDDKKLIMMLEISAQNSNLKGFFIDGLQNQGVENYRGDFENSIAFFYALLPDNQNFFEFSYFNKIKKKLENIRVNIELNDENIATQSDLNPISKQLNIYQKYACFALCALFLLIFIFKRKKLFLIFAILFLALGFFINTNSKEAILKSGANVKILPTQNSTYFYTSSFDENVKILGARNEYIKILLNDGKIGWVKRNDLQD